MARWSRRSLGVGFGRGPRLVAQRDDELRNAGLGIDGHVHVLDLASAYAWSTSSSSTLRPTRRTRDWSPRAPRLEPHRARERASASRGLECAAEPVCQAGPALWQAPPLARPALRWRRTWMRAGPQRARLARRTARRTHHHGPLAAPDHLASATTSRQSRRSDKPAARPLRAGRPCASGCRQARHSPTPLRTSGRPRATSTRASN